MGALNATDFFLNKSGQPKGQLSYNNYGLQLQRADQKRTAPSFSGARSGAVSGVVRR